MHSISLSGRLTVDTFEDNKALLLGGISQQEGSVVADLSAVEAVDMIGLQLLIAARKELAEVGRDFSVLDESGIAARACGQLFVNPALAGIGA